jgi:hypothetical protein
MNSPETQLELATISLLLVSLGLLGWYATDPVRRRWGEWLAVQGAVGLLLAISLAATSPNRGRWVVLAALLTLSLPFLKLPWFERQRKQTMPREAQAEPAGPQADQTLLPASAAHTDADSRADAVSVDHTHTSSQGPPSIAAGSSLEQDAPGPSSIVQLMKPATETESDPPLPDSA